jgi:hypothetical protein
MLDLPDEIKTILATKTATKYTGSDLDAMRAVADSSKTRSLADFTQVLFSKFIIRNTSLFFLLIGLQKVPQGTANGPGYQQTFSLAQ